MGFAVIRIAHTTKRKVCRILVPQGGWVPSKSSCSLLGLLTYWSGCKGPQMTNPRHTSSPCFGAVLSCVYGKLQLCWFPGKTKICFVIFDAMSAAHCWQWRWSGQTGCQSPSSTKQSQLPISWAIVFEWTGHSECQWRWYLWHTERKRVFRHELFRRQVGGLLVSTYGWIPIFGRAAGKKKQSRGWQS